MFAQPALPRRNGDPTGDSSVDSHRTKALTPEQISVPS